MNTRIYLPSELPPINCREVFRYAGGGDDDLQKEILNSCLDELLPELTYRVVWSEYPVSSAGDELDLSFAKTLSQDLSKNLKDCETIILFAATVGISPDRLSMKYSRISPVRSLFIEAIASERIEALCDTFCRMFENTRPRFSPGYGDLPLELQRDIITSLDAGRQIGLTLNESLLMTPTKSVTAIVGIK
jgi:hypothetical protein